MKKVIYISVLVLFLASLLRFLNLNSLPVFADESIYVRWSQVMKAEATLRFLPLSDGKQPLFMWTVIPFLKVFTDPLVAGRIVSGLCGLVTALGVGLAAFVLFNNKRIAVFSLVIWAVLPYAVFFDRLALVDSMLAMFVVWSFVFSYLSLHLLRLDMAMLAGFSLGFAWLTKSPALFSFALIPTLLIFSGWWHQPSGKKLISVALILVSYAIGFGMYNILRLGPEFQMIAIRNKDYVIPLSEVLKHPLDPLIPHLKDVLDFFLYLTTPVGLGLILLGLVEGSTSKHVRQRFILLLWWLVPILAQAFVAKTFTARYLLFTLPFAVILMAHGLWHVGDRTRKHFLALAGLGLLVFLCLGSDYLLITAPEKVPLPRNERSGYLETWTAGTGIREVADYLKKIPGNTPVVVGSEGFFGTPFSALEMYLNGYSHIRVIGIGLGVNEISQDLVNALKDNQVYMVINSDRFTGDPDKMGLQLLAAYPKAAAVDGSREYLLFFKLPSIKK